MPGAEASHEGIIIDDLGIEPEEVDQLVDDIVVPEAACALKVAHDEYPQFFNQRSEVLDAHTEDCGDCQKREIAQQGLN